MKKENVLTDLFFNEPSKRWHFDQLLKAADISRPQAALWLRKFLADGLIQRVKPRGRMPYYVAKYADPSYQVKKKAYAINTLERAGLLSHLAGLAKAKTIILFGSMSRWDWHKDSDIDIFIYGDAEGFDKTKYRSKLHREIETFICRNKDNLRQFKPALLRNVMEGYLVKGTLEFVDVIYA